MRVHWTFRSSWPFSPQQKIVIYIILWYFLFILLQLAWSDNCRVLLFMSIGITIIVTIKEIVSAPTILKHIIKWGSRTIKNILLSSSSILIFLGRLPFWIFCRSSSILKFCRSSSIFKFWTEKIRYDPGWWWWWCGFFLQIIIPL